MMGAVWMRTRSELRSRWRAWAALAAFLGLFAGAVMAVAAGARRTDSSYQRFLTWSRAWDVELPHYPASYAPAFAQVDLDKADRLPQVAEAVRVWLFQSVHGPEYEAVGSDDPRFETSFTRPKVLSGRLPRPDRPDEVAVNFATAEQQGLRLGDRLHLDFVEAGVDPRSGVTLPVTLGFVRRQMWATVAWQASTLAVVALTVGLPLGVAGGRWAWSAFASQSGILPESSVNAPILLLAIPATILLANLMAGVPGRIAARMQPAQVLRTE